MTIHMAMDIPMVMVILASLPTKKYPRKSPNIISQLLRIMSYLFLPSLGPPPPTHTSIVSHQHPQSLLLFMRWRTK